MAFKFFTVPIHDCLGVEAELNTFLRSHTVLSVRQEWVEQGSMSFWSFCVDYLDQATNGVPRSRKGNERGKIDYRELLSDEASRWISESTLKTSTIRSSCND